MLFVFMDFKKVKNSFTLIELLVTMTVFSIVLVITISLFLTMYRGKMALDARQTLTRDSYFLLERLQTMMKDYTIDYEEYRNRQYAWCSSTWDATRNMDDACGVFTHYGNVNSNYPQVSLWTAPHATQHRLFYCSSSNDLPNNGLGTDQYKVFWSSVGLSNGIEAYIKQCLNKAKPTNIANAFLQSYGQYATLFTDVKDDVDSIPWAVGDDDDDALGNIVVPAITEDPQELYLISRDGKERLFLRRKQTHSAEWSTWYRLQVLQLRGFDAGVNHDFDTNHLGVYDGVIDTWACDDSLGFKCSWDPVGTSIYSWYRLPLDVNDGREDLTHDDIVISDWRLDVQPLSDPHLSWADTTAQINPYIKIFFTAKLSQENWKWKLTPEQINQYTISLQTMFSFLPAQY